MKGMNQLNEHLESPQCGCKILEKILIPYFAASHSGLFQTHESGNRRTSEQIVKKENCQGQIKVQAIVHLGKLCTQ